MYITCPTVTDSKALADGHPVNPEPRLSEAASPVPMSKSSRSFEQVSQHFKCPIHLGKLRDPRRLPCEHALCKDCLKVKSDAFLKL